MRLSTQMIRVDLESMNKSRWFRRLNWYWNANSRRRQCTIRKQCKIDSMFHAVHLFTNGSWKASKYGNWEHQWHTWRPLLRHFFVFYHIFTSFVIHYCKRWNGIYFKRENPFWVSWKLSLTKTTVKRRAFASGRVLRGVREFHTKNIEGKYRRNTQCHIKFSKIKKFTCRKKFEQRHKIRRQKSKDQNQTKTDIELSQSSYPFSKHHDLLACVVTCNFLQLLNWARCLTASTFIKAETLDNGMFLTLFTSAWGLVLVMELLAS